MKKGFFKRLVSGIVTGFMCLTAIPNVPQLQSKAADDYQNTFQKDGYDFEVWNQYSQGNISFDAGNGGTYKCTWSGIHNILFRAGKKWSNDPKWDTLNGISVDYSCDYNPNGNSYLCVYGWTTDPLVEYYIVDSYGSWRPPGTSDSMKLMGTVVVDGGTYEVYSGTHDGPSIQSGVTHFNQYWSVRVDSQLRTSGVINIDKHFKAWEETFGMKMGGLHEVALNVEGWQSSGTANVTKNDLTIGGGIIDDPVIEPVEPDEDGNYFKSTFESGTDNWKSRGDASIKTDPSVFYNGSQALAVTGRTDNWHGASFSLPTDAFIAGKTYSFSTGVLQKSGDDVNMQLTLQYTLDGKENYDKVASATAKSGEWTKLENTAFTIPSGATGLLLYVEGTDSLTDFWIDDAAGSVEGTKSSVVTGGGFNGEAVVTTTTTAATAAITTTTTSATQAVTSTTSSTGTAKLPGDANGDGQVTIADATAILQYLGNKDKYGLDDDARENADVYNKGDGITSMDASVIQQYDAHLVTELPVSYLEEPLIHDATTVPETDAVIVTTTADVISVESIVNSFESGNSGWTARGSSILSSDSESYYSGSKSVKVSGREKDWNGIGYELDNSFVPGNAYSFSAAVMQASGSTVEMKLTLQYTGADGEPHYDNIASADAADKTWTKLENTSFTIPEGATDLLLYVETTTSLTDFYIDDVMTAAEGVKSNVVTGGGTVGDIAAPETGTVEGVDISWIDPSKPMVAISFDDGAVGSASTDSSMRIINAVADAGFHATFFYVGDWIRNASGEQEVKYAYSKGMEIANHTTSHPDLATLGEAQIRSEYDNTTAKLRNIIGAEPSKLMRLPYLSSNSTVESVLYDVPLISCAIDTGDWNKATKDQIISTVTNAMNNGSLNGAIVLCHETYDTTAAAMEYLAPYLKEQGWQIVTISEMFAVKNKELQGGKIYRSINS